MNSAGLNMPQRGWSEITPSGIDAVVGANLNGPFYASRAVLPTMRAQRDGLIIHVSSWAGRYVSKLTGPAYSADRHGLVALLESLNQEECGHGIRSWIKSICTIAWVGCCTPTPQSSPSPCAARHSPR
ncbi:SDR family oxidoreductase [Methylobacterium sp. E-005]|uniref:SDR family oxidoreductase n=1 Tax=Methylobacterium sp. E-005 TaxID=2836549 RepID=UPI00391D264F